MAILSAILVLVLLFSLFLVYTAGSDLDEILGCQSIGVVESEDLQSQGFTIMNVKENEENVPYALTCFVDGSSEGEKDMLVVTNMNTGKVICKKNIAGGHMNSATNDGTYFYITCGGGASVGNYILKVSQDLTEISEIKLLNGEGKKWDPYNPWCIAYNKGYFYVGLSGGLFVKCKQDAEGDLRYTDDFELTLTKDYKYRGIYCDGKCIYMPCGKKNDNGTYSYRIEKYHMKTGKMVFVNCPDGFSELEELDVWNNKLYGSCNSANSAKLFLLTVSDGENTMTDGITNNMWYTRCYADDIGNESSYTGLLYYGTNANDCAWYYIADGHLDLTYTGMAKNDYGWWYVTDGKLDENYTGLADNDYGTWYFQNGKLQTGYSGTVTLNGKTYTVKNGKVV